MLYIRVILRLVGRTTSKAGLCFYYVLCLYAAMQLAVDQLIIVVKMSFEFTIKYAQITFTTCPHIDSCNSSLYTVQGFKKYISR